MSVNKKQIQNRIDNMSVLERAAAPTPKFFQKLKIIGITLVAVSAAILATPAMPAIVVTIAGYVGLAGTVASAVSQAAVDGEAAAAK